MRIKLSMYLHFYLVYLLLNSCNGNNGTPATWSRASLTHLHAYNKTWSRKLLVIGKSGYMHVWRHKSSFWTSAKIKPAPFRANNSLTRKTRCVLRHFCCSYLKANKLQLANIGAFFETQCTLIIKQEVKVIWQKAPHGGPIPRLGVTPGGRKLYH